MAKGVKIPNINGCPDWQANGFCYYDCKALHCKECEYGESKEWMNDSAYMPNDLKFKK